MKEQSQHKNTLALVELSLFSAIIIIMAFTPFLGYIPLGFTRATIIHIPVILGSLRMGPKKGCMLGLVFGLTSLVNNTINPTVTSFVFTPFYSLGEIKGGIGSLVICLLPRTLVGVIPYYIYHLGNTILFQVKNKGNIALVAAGISGALTNTLLVMHLIFFFYKDAYAAANNVSSEAVYTFIVGIIAMNGIPEAIVAGVLILALGKIFMKKRT